MNSFNILIILGTLAFAQTLAAIPRIDTLDTNIDDLDLRDADGEITPRKPTRDNGLASLLLKNLRFRDLYDQVPPASNSLYDSPRRPNLQTNGHMLSGNDNAIYPGEMQKRGAVSVSQLAELLHSLKSRGLDDEGVKLQSLRFGRK